MRSYSVVFFARLASALATFLATLVASLEETEDASTGARSAGGDWEGTGPSAADDRRSAFLRRERAMR